MRFFWQKTFVWIPETEFFSIGTLRDKSGFQGHMCEFLEHLFIELENKEEKQEHKH